MDSDQVVAYLQARGSILKKTQPMFKRRTYSFESPHTCNHCQNLAVNVAARDSTQEVSFSSKPANSLSAAIVASESGCALYEWLVDVFVYNEILLKPDGDWQTHECLRSSCPAFSLLSIWNTATGPNTLCELEVYIKSRVPGTGATEQSWIQAKTSSYYIHRQLAQAVFPEPDAKPLEADPFWKDQETLYGWTTGTGPASGYITSRPYETDVKSTESIQFARNCLRTCLEKHDRCRQIGGQAGKAQTGELLTVDQIPSRLLGVTGNPDPSRAKLVEVQRADSHTRTLMTELGYAALSYCWGGDQPVKLTKGTQQELENGIAISELPRTLRDAISVARDLGFNYLWIDALCIIQDDKDDQNREIAHMASYYNNARLTISATSSWRCVDGFLGKREPVSYQFGPVRLPLRDEQGDAGVVYLVKDDQIEDPANPRVEPTTTRAWTLQESLLSRRILIFAEKQLYWTCVQGFAGCGGHFAQLVDRVFVSAQSLVDKIYPMGSLADRPATNQWALIVEAFTERSLSFPGDKLPAVSALAANLNKVFEERGNRPVYLAGLFMDLTRPASWPSQLLWTTSDPSKSERARDYRAPSWSWAAIDGLIEIDRFRLPLDFGTEHVDASVEDFQVDLESKLNPFGNVTSGFLALRARMFPVTECPLSPYIAVQNEVGLRQGQLALYPDTQKDKDSIEASFARKDLGGSPFLVCLWLEESAAYGLTVAATVDGKFTRTGIFAVDYSMNKPGPFSSIEHQIIQVI